MSTQMVYYDSVDAEMDGFGWNVVDGGAIAARFASFGEAVWYALELLGGRATITDTLNRLVLTIGRAD